MEREEGEENRPILRSINNIHNAYVRFVNTTSYNVGVYWIDYQGKAVRYKVLSHRDTLDINTFVTHPWIFVDEETKDRFVANGSDVFYPEPYFAKYQGMRREELPQRIERDNVNIGLPMYTLRDLTLRVIKRRLRYDHHAFQLDIPNLLQHELATMEPIKLAPTYPRS